MLRLGTAGLPSAVELTDPAADEHRSRLHWLIADAPVTVPLAGRGVAGVAGPGDVARAAGRWLVAQVAALHSPEDVQVCVLTGANGQAAWEWARWLPHCRPAEGQNCAVLIGNDAETVAARIAELQAIIAARQQAPREQARGRDLVVVFDGSRRLRSLPGALQVLREGPEVGVYSICLDSDERLLPAECQTVVAAGPDGALTVAQMNEPAVGEVRPEYVTPGWAERLARSIAPVRDISAEGDDAGLPEACRLLDVLGAEPPAAEAIAARWQAVGPSTYAVIGACYDGPFGIDLRKDGPHALIAGTTGAGKSELLQTLIASLALVNRPDEMTFVLVDYKGGSAFKDCVHLPHVTGMVTDLDAHLTRRALASLTAELTGREKILAAAGAKDIEEYTERAGHQPRHPPLPPLVIVIDEFASLARDLPDFVAGLVGIAQRGRSLGLHLILATQRPSGVVSADIRANTNLRIALRMTDVAESASSEDKGDQHFRGLLVLRIGTGEEPGHIALLHEGAVDEVPADQCHGDQPPDADGDRRADHRQQDAGVNRVPDRPVRAGCYQLGVFLCGRRHSPVPAEVDPRPDGQSQAEDPDGEADAPQDRVCDVFDAMPLQHPQPDQEHDDQDERHADAREARPVAPSPLSPLGPGGCGEPAHPEDDPAHADHDVYHSHRSTPPFATGPAA